MATASKSKTIYFELISPDKQLIGEDVLRLVAVSETGEIGILPNHADMVAKLGSGPLRYWDSRNIESVVAVLGGVIEVKDNRITVITDFAMMGAEIDEAEAEHAAQKARTELEIRDKPKSSDDQRQLALMELKLIRELVKLKTARLHKDL